MRIAVALLLVAGQGVGSVRCVGCVSGDVTRGRGAAGSDWRRGWPPWRASCCSGVLAGCTFVLVRGVGRNPVGAVGSWVWCWSPGCVLCIGEVRALRFAWFDGVWLCAPLTALQTLHRHRPLDGDADRSSGPQPGLRGRPRLRSREPRAMRPQPRTGQRTDRPDAGPVDPALASRATVYATPRVTVSNGAPQGA